MKTHAITATSHPLVSLPPVEIVSVNVAEPQLIGTFRGQPVTSGIAKQPVTQAALALDWLNLAGDRQADLRVHGGPDKAVYAYPWEHVERWNAELAPETLYGPGLFGENLTTRGWLEDAVHIGDIWAWGDALLQVSQPRHPCYKLGMRTGRRDIIKRMEANGRSGWYLRVLQPGTVPTAGPITVVEQALSAPTILEDTGGAGDWR
ncbi:MAG: MOSC domain-containing protein [Thermomicrobiales bacterium]|nr:MOSC domain-containing protein [Thermomicrobiales bacterium]